MTKRNNIIEALETTTEKKSIQMKVSYDIGGVNHFTGENSHRGYYLHATPIHISEGFISYYAFTGYKKPIELTNRFSQKKLDQISDTIKENPKYRTLLEALLNKNFLVLKNPIANPNPSAPEEQTEEIPK